MLIVAELWLNYPETHHAPDWGGVEACRRLCVTLRCGARCERRKNRLLMNRNAIIIPRTRPYTRVSPQNDWPMNDRGLLPAPATCANNPRTGGPWPDKRPVSGGRTWRWYVARDVIEKLPDKRYAAALRGIADVMRQWQRQAARCWPTPWSALWRLSVVAVADDRVIVAVNWKEERKLLKELGSGIEGTPINIMNRWLLAWRA